LLVKPRRTTNARPPSPRSVAASRSTTRAAAVRATRPTRAVKIIVEKHADGYVAYPLGIPGVVVGQGDTYDAALADCTSALRFHIETFGPDLLRELPAVVEAFVAETRVVA
jgi:predicted RNase H-like HicB family nuclease